MSDLISRKAAIDNDINVPINDTISRQAAIDAVSRGCQEFRGIFAECEKNLNELPSAQPDHSGDVNGKVDLIDRQAAIDAVKYLLDSMLETDTIGFYEIENILFELPSAQPEIIRCKDCKHYKAHEYTGKLACHYVIGGTVVRDLNDFCSRAERITDG